MSKKSKLIGIDKIKEMFGEDLSLWELSTSQAADKRGKFIHMVKHRRVEPVAMRCFLDTLYGSSPEHVFDGYILMSCLSSGYNFKEIYNSIEDYVKSPLALYIKRTGEELEIYKWLEMDEEDVNTFLPLANKGLILAFDKNEPKEVERLEILAKLLIYRHSYMYSMKDSYINFIEDNIELVYGIVESNITYFSCLSGNPLEYFAKWVFSITEKIYNYLVSIHSVEAVNEVIMSRLENKGCNYSVYNNSAAREFSFITKKFGNCDISNEQLKNVLGAMSAMGHSLNRDCRNSSEEELVRGFYLNFKTAISHALENIGSYDFLSSSTRICRLGSIVFRFEEDENIINKVFINICKVDGPNQASATFIDAKNCGFEPKITNLILTVNKSCCTSLEYAIVNRKYSTKEDMALLLNTYTKHGVKTSSHNNSFDFIENKYLLENIDAEVFIASCADIMDWNCANRLFANRTIPYKIISKYRKYLNCNSDGYFYLTHQQAEAYTPGELLGILKILKGLVYSHNYVSVRNHIARFIISSERSTEQNMNELLEIPGMVDYLFDNHLDTVFPGFKL